MDSNTTKCSPVTLTSCPNSDSRETCHRLYSSRVKEAKFLYTKTKVRGPLDCTHNDWVIRLLRIVIGNQLLVSRYPPCKASMKKIIWAWTQVSYSHLWLLALEVVGVRSSWRSLNEHRTQIKSERWISKWGSRCLSWYLQLSPNEGIKELMAAWESLKLLS